MPQGEVFWPLQSNSEFGSPGALPSPYFGSVSVIFTFFQKWGCDTLPHLKKKSMSSLTFRISFNNCNCFLLDPWPSFVNLCGWTLSQANLGIPKFPTLSWQVQKGLIKTLSQCFVKKTLISLINETLIWEEIIPSFPSWGTQVKSTLDLSYLTWLLSQLCALITTIKP